MNKLIFFNHFNNGDIHYAREFIKDIINKTNYDEYYFFSKRSHRLLIDISKLNPGSLDQNCLIDSPFYNVNSDTYINTHLNVYEIFVDKVVDASLDTFYDYFQIIFNKLKIPIERKKYYIPTVDYSVYDVININEYINNNRKNIKILICNGEVHSSQSLFVDFNNLVEKLSDNYPNIHFILTNKINTERENILYTSDIIKSTHDSDLNEISYLSTYCSMIIGRSSGPYTFTNVKQNLNDPDKILVSMCNIVTDLVFYNKVLCTKVWINNFDPINIYETINYQIPKINSYSNIFDVKSVDDKIFITLLDDCDDEITIEFYRDKEILYNFTNRFAKGFSYWVKPHGHYHKDSWKVKCQFYKGKDYLFQKVI